MSAEIQTPGRRPNSPGRTGAAFYCSWLAGFALLACLFCGCCPSHYRRSADKEVYGIIHRAEGKILHHTNAFTIDTPYSHRKPSSITPAELMEDRLQTNQRVLTIEAALDLAVSHSRAYQSAKELLYLTALTLTGKRYAFSPQFFASSKGTVTRLASGEELRGLSSQVGVSQLLQTGGKLGVSLANDVLRYYTGNPRQSVVSVMSVNLTQPLLRGFGRNSASVEALTQAERNVVYEVRNFSYFQDQFALEIVNDYFALLASKDVIRNRYTNYLGRVQSTKRLEERANDRERLSDVDQARQAELTAKNNYVNAVADYRNSLDQFKIKLGIPLGEKVVLDDQTLDEMEQHGLVPAPLQPEAAYRMAVHKQLQILNAIDKFEDSKRKIRVAADAFKPDLNVVGSASLDSQAPVDYTRFNGDQVSAQAGFELNLPLDRLRERNDYRATLVTFESDLRNFTLTLDKLKDSIERGLRTLDQRRQNFEIQKNALDLANRRVASTTLLLEAGRAEVRDLVDSQDAQISAQNAVTTALVDYQQTRLQLMLDVGALSTAQPKFWLKNHLANFRQSETAGAAPPLGARGVLPPDSYFEN